MTRRHRVMVRTKVRTHQKAAASIHIAPVTTGQQQRFLALNT